MAWIVEAPMLEEILPSADLGRRVREIRVELHGEGESGLEAISASLGLPAGTWANFERGVIVPAPLLLRFLSLTQANPQWLLNGSGPRFLDPSIILSDQLQAADSLKPSET
jgi:hypothetical protein